MFRKLQKTDFYIHKLEHLTMQVLKFGKTNLTMPNQTFGLWDALFMR